MSVQTNLYVVIGVKLPWDGEFDTEEFHEYTESYEDSAFEGIQSKDDLTCIADGMSGEYIVIGMVLAKSDQYGYLDGILTVEDRLSNHGDPSKLDAENWELTKQHVRKKIKDNFAEKFPTIMNYPINTHVFLHER